MQLQVPRQKRDQTINKKQGTAELNLKKSFDFRFECQSRK